MNQRLSLQLEQRGTRQLAVWCFFAITLIVVLQSVNAGTPWRRDSSSSSINENNNNNNNPLKLKISHPLSKRALFYDLECKGVYDSSIFSKLDRICEDCYNLFKLIPLHSLCRKNCFTSDYFKACVDTLQLTDEVEQIKTWIKQSHGASPQFDSDSDRGEHEV